MKYVYSVPHHSLSENTVYYIYSWQKTMFVVNIKCPNKTLYYINMILNSFVFLDKIHPCIYITPVYLQKYSGVSR